ncbi:hypothetical protein CORC01_05723 [Colletotrichum orchidophilum]|uniref:Uncharacterized protein n=1 Tax=Colletotrichum orchidophilum TaxID=1209926 RepID=A0A1G4BCB9_9PEZI|nr:uncharacterized protein CORC01_05723 [Colletotrichum orchidophilum]OHE99033.1 hypothetical protein CORC01_05723 [Colletotrichum orchidophilum]
MRFQVLLAGAAAVAISVAAGPNLNPHKIRQDLTKKEQVNQINPENEAPVLKARECDIVCPANKLWCEYRPYKYRCDRSGKLRYDQRNLDCENVSWGCTCACDWRVPGTESVDDDNVEEA